MGFLFLCGGLFFLFIEELPFFSVWAKGQAWLQFLGGGWAWCELQLGLLLCVWHFLFYRSFFLFALCLFYKPLGLIYKARRFFHKARRHLHTTRCNKHKARHLLQTTRSNIYKVRRLIHKVRSIKHKARSNKYNVRRLIHKARRLFDTSLLFIETPLPLFVNLRSWFDSTFRSFDIVGNLLENRILHFLFSNIFFLVKVNHTYSPCWFFYSDYSQLFRAWYSFYKIICSYISH